MSKEYGRWIPLAKNGEQSGIWVDNSLGISRGGVVGVRTDDGSFISSGVNGLTAIVGDGATVTTGSPRRLVIQPDAMVKRIAKRVDVQAIEIAQNTTAVATKAAQTDLDALSSELSAKASTDMADIGTAGLVQKAADPGDVSTGALVLLTDAITAIGLLEAKINQLMAAQRSAGIIG